MSAYDDLSFGQSSDDMPLRVNRRPLPKAHQIDEFPSDLNGFTYQPVARPQYIPSHHFWKNPTWLSIVIFVGDLVLTFAPALFILLCFQALKVDGRPISSRGKTVEQAAKLGPTLFPVIFASVVGRLMRTYALWRAERGASLGILEQLNGSQNLLAAIERAVLLPGLGILSLGVVVLWMLSPLGGQSSLRVLGRENAPTFNATTMYYYNSTDDFASSFSGASGSASASATINGIFAGALSSLNRVKGSDVWGNIRIPFLDHVPTYQNGESTDGWYEFSENDYQGPYSALTGIVVNGLKTGLDFNFTLQSSYFNLTCSEPEWFNVTDTFDPFVQWLNTSNPILSVNESEIFVTDTTINSYLVNADWNLTDPFTVVYASIGSFESEIAGYRCPMQRTQVDSDILCHGTACEVRRIRLLPSFDSLTMSSPFPEGSVTVPANLFNWLGTATSLRHSGQVSPIDWFVYGSNIPFQLQGDYLDYHNATTTSVAQHLASLINTGYQLSVQLGATAQPPSTNTTALQLSTNRTTYYESRGGVGYITARTNATTTQHNEVFVAHHTWVAVTLTVSFILLLCGTLSLWFKYASHAPDVLGFVSSMTRDNPYFEHIPGGDRLDGLQRARLLRHVRVQFADGDDGRIRLRNLGHSAS